jgi:hypothetical protein
MLGTPSFQLQVPAEFIAVPGETAKKLAPDWTRFGYGRAGTEQADAIDLRRGLRDGAERPRGHTGKRKYEFSPSQNHETLPFAGHANAMPNVTMF